MQDIQGSIQTLLIFVSAVSLCLSVSDKSCDLPDVQLISVLVKVFDSNKYSPRTVLQESIKR